MPPMLVVLDAGHLAPTSWIKAGETVNLRPDVSKKSG
jgi:hypothetical protein